MAKKIDRSEIGARPLKRNRKGLPPPDTAHLQAPMSPEQSKQMLCAMESQQIQLEMQNAELRRAQAELEVSRERYLDLYELAPVGYFTLNEQGDILEANLTANKLLGVKKGALVNQPLSGFIFRDDQDIFYKHRKALFRTGAAQGCELRLTNKGGTLFWTRMESTLKPLSDGSLVYRAVISDITERKQTEQALSEAQTKLKAYAVDLEKTVASRTAKLQERTAECEQAQAELLKISEREKQLIAQELHDGLCQHFAGTAMMASLLQRQLAAQAYPEADSARLICELLNTGVKEARNLSHGLHPVSPEGNGLMDALSGLARTVTQLYHIECNYSCKDAVLIDDQNAATHLFRIAQEAINNAMKHGEARQVFITLNNTADGVTLSIRDDGIGIPRKQPSSGGMGLQIMKHRAKSIGAGLTISRAGRRGTLVSCTLRR